MHPNHFKPCVFDVQRSKSLKDVRTCMDLNAKALVFFQVYMGQFWALMLICYWPNFLVSEARLKILNQSTQKPFSLRTQTHALIHGSIARVGYFFKKITLTVLDSIIQLIFNGQKYA